MVNLVYAVIQLIHNLGAATIVAAPALAWHGELNEHAIVRRFSAVAALGWTTQIASGAGFGIASHYIKGQLPEIGGVALIALFIKVACAVGGLIISTVILRTAGQGENVNSDLWIVMAALGVIALSAAAFLRWYL